MLESGNKKVVKTLEDYLRSEDELYLAFKAKQKAEKEYTRLNIIKNNMKKNLLGIAEKNFETEEFEKGRIIKTELGDVYMIDIGNHWDEGIGITKVKIHE